MSHLTGWIGVDLDGTLAEYNGWRGVSHIGPPIPAMLDRVKAWLADGLAVKIFTARVAVGSDDYPAVIGPIHQWLTEHVGQILPVTNVKDMGMTELWDDRAIQVEQNTGRRVGDHDNPRFSVGETKAHQERVVIEKAELDEKIRKLEVFCFSGNPVFESLETFDKELLVKQLSKMEDYSNLLTARIDRSSL